MYKGKENIITAEHLKNCEECIVVGFGQSMTPILKSGQPVRVVPIDDSISLNKNDIVFVKISGHYYLHKISAIKNDVSYQILNNNGHINGWVSRNSIYGKAVEIL